MKIRGHGNAVAIALAGLAVVLAATGTAYAVTATTVHIADPTATSHIAQVDSAGRLKTVGASINLNTNTYLSIGLTALTSPTTATLAITRVAYFNTGKNSAYANTDFNIALVKINVGATGTCYSADASLAVVYSRARVAVGTNFIDPYSSPIIVKPTGTKKYCVGTALYSDDSSASPNAYYNPAAQFTGFVSSGTYSGTGIDSSPAVVSGNPPTTPSNPHPAGIGVH